MATDYEADAARFKAMLRPVVEDAAQSLDWSGQGEKSQIMAWFDRATMEDLQLYVMGCVQDGISLALGAEAERDAGG